MSDLDLCYLTATEAIRRFKARDLSPVELMQAVIDRAREVEPAINAFTFEYFDEALDKARKAEAKYMKTDGRVRALEGLPMAVKDESYIKGKPTTNASLTMKDFVADKTSPYNDRLLRAGAICHARTATPEFSCAGYTNSKMWGVTRNPWNLEFTPGGSSGGSAASLSAGTSTLATGSDIGGSIRIPASCCGLVGFKAPYGRNPEETPFNLDFYCHTGPLTRSVSDSILMQNVTAGPHVEDIASLRPKLRLPTSYKPIEGWKIAFSMDLGFFEVDREVQANTRAALDVLKSLGASVEEVELGWGPDVLDAGLAYLEHLFGASISPPLLDEHADDLTPYARMFAEKGRSSTSTEFSSDASGRRRDVQVTRAHPSKASSLCLSDQCAPGRPGRFRPVLGHGHHQQQAGEPDAGLGHDHAVQYAQPVSGAVGAVRSGPRTACRPAFSWSARPIATRTCSAPPWRMKRRGRGLGRRMRDPVFEPIWEVSRGAV